MRTTSQPRSASELPEGSQAPSVTIVSLHYAPEPTGNAPYVRALAVGLAHREHSVNVITTHPHYPEWKIRDGYGAWRRKETLHGVAVERLLHYVPRPPRGIRRLVSEISFGIRATLTTWGTSKTVILVSPSLFASAIATLRTRFQPSRRTLLWVQDIYTLGLGETAQGSATTISLIRKLEAATLRRADRVVVIHERFAHYLSTQLMVPADRVTVIRNWTHLPPSPPISKSEGRARLGWPDGTTIAVHAGNMGVKQGLDTVVEAARIAAERGVSVHYFLVGDGSDRARLAELGRDVTNLHFIDPLDDVDFRHALAAADVLLVNERPGVAEMAVPSKLTSYFDAGRAVVASTEESGITGSEVRLAGAGVVTRAGDARALHDAVTAIGADETLMNQYGASARRFREMHLGEDTALDRWQGVLASSTSSTHE